MENQHMPVSEDLNCIDTDVSEPELTPANDYDQHLNFDGNRSLSMVATGSSRADTQRRKRFSGEPSRRNPFTALPRDIRNHIYEYLTFLHLEFDAEIEEGYNARSLALTCRQARQELNEERLRRFWMYLRKVEELHLTETGCKLSFPAILKSKSDLQSIKSLKANINCNLPLYEDDLPNALTFLSNLPLKELVLHYTGPKRKSENFVSFWIVKTLFMSICSVANKDAVRPENITLSWNRQVQPVNTPLAGYTFELCPSDKSSIRQKWLRNTTDNKTSWPAFRVLVSDDMDVGVMRLSRVPRDVVARKGLSQLMKHYDVLHGTSTDGFETMITFQIQSMYMVD